MKPGPKGKKDKMTAISICLPLSAIKMIKEKKNQDASTSQYIYMALLFYWELTEKKPKDK